MSKVLHLKFREQEARGRLPKGMANPLTYATLAEAGVRAALEGYYGTPAVREAYSAARDEQRAVDISDDILGDVRSILKVYGSVEDAMRAGKDWAPGIMAAGGGGLTTSDFPKALASLRQRTIRQETPIGRSMWRSWVAPRNIRTVPDFKQIRGLTPGQAGELKLRPEGTDVQYTKLSFTADGYFLANYERAVGYTWEMWLNDEIGLFTTLLRKLGEGAARTEAIVIFNAILNGVSRSAETGITTGGPTSDRIVAARKAMAARTVTDADATSTVGEIMGSDIVYPSEWEDTVDIALGTRYTDFNMGAPNLAYQKLSPHMERLWARVFTSDWIVFDRDVDWLEVAFLEGFQSGPMTYTQLPDEREHPDQGSFSKHSLAVKVGHNLGAKVTNTNGVLRNQGA